MLLDDELSLFDSEELLFELDPVELYRSEYQPPPFKMKPPPREICRFASAFPQDGQSFNGSALMGC